MTPNESAYEEAQARYVEALFDRMCAGPKEKLRRGGTWLWDWKLERQSRHLDQLRRAAENDDDDSKSAGWGSPTTAPPGRTEPAARPAPSNQLWAEAGTGGVSRWPRSRGLRVWTLRCPYPSVIALKGPISVAIHSIDILEEQTGIVLDDLFTDDKVRREHARSTVLGSDFPALKAAMDDLASQPQPPYGVGQLVPRLFDSHFNYMGGGITADVSPARVGAHYEDVMRNLLYAHKVETEDPLPYAVNRKAHRSGGENFILLSALHKWYKLRGLVDRDIVRMTYAPTDRGYVDLNLLLEELAPNRSFRKAVVDVFPDLVDGVEIGRRWGSLKPAGWGGSTHRDDLVTRRRDLVGDEAEGPYRSSIRTQAFIAATSPLLGGHPFDNTIRDLATFYRESRASSADLWLPTTRHLSLLEAFQTASASAPLQPSDKLMTLQAVAFPGTDRLTPEDVATIRMNEPVFDDWRKAVELALSRFDRAVALGEEADVAAKVAKEILLDAAQNLLSDLETQKLDVWKGVSKGLVMGTAGASPALFMGASNPVLWGAGATLAAAGNWIWGRAEKRKLYRAENAVYKHIVAFLSG